MLDDELLIVDNPVIRGLTVDNMKTAFTSYDPELYIPLTLLTHQIEYQFFGLNPIPYHVTSLLLHIISVLCMYGSFDILFTRRTALLIALLYAIHPLNVEAVSWASGRKDVLSACFCFASLYAYLKARDAGSSLYRSIFLFLCALLSKVSIALFPGVLIAIEWYRGEKISVQMFKRFVPYIALSILFIIIALFGKQEQHMSPIALIELAGVSVPFYLSKFIFPFNLSVFYPFLDNVTLFHPRIFTGLLLCIFISLACIACRKRHPQLLTGWIIFGLLVAPSFSNVFKGGEAGVPDVYFASDRYVYCAIIGLLFVLGSYLHHEKVRKVVMGIIPLFAVLCFFQTCAWQTSEKLFVHSIATGQPAHIAYLNLASIRWQQGERQEAAELLADSLRHKPSSRAYNNLGQIVEARGDLQSALTLYKEGVALAPHNLKIRTHLGRTALTLGQHALATEHLSYAAERGYSEASILLEEM